jgi:FkbM family methyltransferase
VGSNLGLHALTVAKQRPDVRVWAFEPNPAMAALARSAAEANQVAVDVREVALDSRSGRAALYLHEGNAGRNSLCDLGAGVRLPHIDVDTVLADNLVASAAIGSPNVVKIDVEGAEPRVLAGMRGILRGDRVHTVVFEDGAAAQTPTKRILHAAGFAIDPLIRREATHHLLENFVARR